MRVYALVLPDALADPPESICHQQRGSGKVHGGAETTDGQISLVLNGAVAAARRHILRHSEVCVAAAMGRSEGES